MTDTLGLKFDRLYSALMGDEINSGFIPETKRNIESLKAEVRELQELYRFRIEQDSKIDNLRDSQRLLRAEITRLNAKIWKLAAMMAGGGSVLGATVASILG